MASSVRPSPALRVPATFESEFPNASRRATETFLNIGLLLGAVRSAAEAVVTDEGLPSMAAFNVLSVLDGDSSPLRPSVIASRMMVTRATITGILDSLEARELIQRRAGETDGRSVEVALTRQGRAIAHRLVPKMHEFERDLMGVLSDRQLDDLLGMVARLQVRVQELAPSARLGIP